MIHIMPDKFDNMKSFEAWVYCIWCGQRRPFWGANICIERYVIIRSFVVVQSLSCVQFFVTPWTAAHQASLSVTLRIWLNSCPLSWGCHPTTPSSVPSSLFALVFPSIRVFSNKLALCIRWPKCWSFSFSISPSSEYYSGLISFRIDWFDLSAVQGTLKSLLPGL